MARFESIDPTSSYDERVGYDLCRDCSEGIALEYLVEDHWKLNKYGEQKKWATHQQQFADSQALEVGNAYPADAYQDGIDFGTPYKCYSCDCTLSDKDHNYILTADELEAERVLSNA